MGKPLSTLTNNGYEVQRKTKNGVVATKGDDMFLIKNIILSKIPQNDVPALTNEMEKLKAISHPHIVSSKNSFKDERENIYYEVMDYCQGGDLATKIRGSEPPQESEILSWIAEICMALKHIHEKDLLHKCLRPENIFFTEFGFVRLGDFGNIHECSKEITSATNSGQLEMAYMPPEIFQNGTYDSKSDIWSMGCILYELCTQERAFSAETTLRLIPKIIHDPCPSLPETVSPDICQLLNHIFSKDPQTRPTASDILASPLMIDCLLNKCRTTVDELQIMLDKLRNVADSLERVHRGTTIGSLTGGVIGAVGGITSIVGLILTPFTFGASLIVTGVGVGVGTLGGLTAGTSNITNIVNQSSDRKAVRSILKEFEQKITGVATWLQEINTIFDNIRSSCGSDDTADSEDSPFNSFNLLKLGRIGRGISGIAELVRLVQVMNIGKIAAQTARVVRMAEVATGVLSVLFIAVDIFFIAMDAKEIHHIRQAQAAGEGSTFGSASDTDDSLSAFGSTVLSLESMMQEHESGTSPTNTTTVKSEIMRFVQSIRKASDNLQTVLDELKRVIPLHPIEAERDQEWIDMELM